MGVFDSPEAHNWLRQWLAVFITRKAILPAVKSEAVKLHTAILTVATLAATVCPQNHGKITDTSKLSCRFHDDFRNGIKHRHKQKPSWKNATTDTWHNDAFSIAKLFMQPSGYDDKTNFDQIDLNGILAFIFNCGRFPTTVESSSDQARISTNKIRHLPDMCSSALTDQATTDCIDNFATLLNDQIFCGEKNVQEALKQLDTLKSTIPELLKDHWKYIIEDIAIKNLQDIHSLFSQEKESSKKEADNKRSEFQDLCDRIVSEITARGETVLFDFKQLVEVSHEAITKAIDNGIKRIEEKTEIGERRIVEKTETGQQKIEGKTKAGKRRIEEKTKIATQKIQRLGDNIQSDITARGETLKQELEEKTEKVRHGVLTKEDLRKELFKLYKKTASTVSIRLDIDEALEKIYEEPKLILKEDGKDKEDDIILNNIFRKKQGTLAKTIIVEGEPGSGKSALCKKIVYEWCETKHEGRTENEGCEISSQFEFVFYITLLRAKKECKIKKMILKHIIDRIGLDRTSTEELLGVVLKSSTCLLLLDGLDEWQHPEGCNWDEKIPHVETSWENCTILITTRPYKLAELKIGCSQIDNHVILKGVTYPRKLVEKIVSRLNDFHGTEIPLDHEICIKDIQYKQLWHFSECPILLAHIVWLWYKAKLSEDMKLSDLYRTLLKERWLESCGKSGSIYINMINVLSKIAFEKLFADDENSTIVFEIDEEQNTKFESQKSASLQSGILSCTNVPGDTPQYHFLHKTFQEYLAALFVSEHIEKCMHIKNTYKIQRKESEMSLFFLNEFFVFLCGLNAKAAEELSKVMNELFTDFCNTGKSYAEDSSKFQDMILKGQIELDRSDNSGVNLCLQHINLDREYLGQNRDGFYGLNDKKATTLERLLKKNQSCILSLNSRHDYNFPSVLEDSSVLDLANCRGPLGLILWNNLNVKNERGGLFSHLQYVSLERIRMPEALFTRLLQTCIRNGNLNYELWYCFIESAKDEEQLQNVFDQQVAPSKCTTSITLYHVTMTAEAFLRLLKCANKCSRFFRCNLALLELTPNHTVANTPFPVVDPDPVMKLLTIDQHSRYLKMKSFQSTQKLNNLFQNCTKYMNFEHMKISEKIFWFFVRFLMHFGYFGEFSLCDIQPDTVPETDNRHLPQMVASHSDAQRVKLTLRNVSMQQAVVERLACQALESGRPVRCTLNACEVRFLHDVKPLKDKLEEQPALRIVEFSKVDPKTSNQLLKPMVERCSVDQTWNICFEANAKVNQFETESDTQLETIRHESRSHAHTCTFRKNVGSGPLYQEFKHLVKPDI
ncbi:uncharacterized protein LOC128221083 [Mya arenaria]|uniref:uncharacterized protein LOC128221083 n=1 Tax=Mya arenaria TaxID=6604 RepID=UPI0022E16E79|nr:uncharacterized protein LOC128221083 [Mya arenaria]